MLQRFAIAHAIIHEPKLIVADEMTANLDPQGRGSLQDLVAKINKKEKTTFLLSSHILPELSRVCDSVAIINRGKVYAAGIIRINVENLKSWLLNLKQLSYVEKIKTDARGISVRIMKVRKKISTKILPNLLKKLRLRFLE